MKAVLQVASRELGDWSRKRICLSWQERVEHDGWLPALRLHDGMSWSE
jgi:hypothetical protein